MYATERTCTPRSASQPSMPLICCSTHCNRCCLAADHGSVAVLACTPLVSLYPMPNATALQNSEVTTSSIIISSGDRYVCVQQVQTTDSHSCRLCRASRTAVPAACGRRKYASSVCCTHCAMRRFSLQEGTPQSSMVLTSVDTITCRRGAQKFGYYNTTSDSLEWTVHTAIQSDTSRCRD